MSISSEQHLLRNLRPLACLAMVAFALSAAGCGSDDEPESASSATTAAETTPASGDSSAAEESSAIVEEARQPLDEFDGPDTAPGKVPSGKKLAVIYPVAAPLPQRASESVKEAAETVGWSARLVNAQGTPQGYVSSLEQAVSSGVDGIVLVAMPVALLQDQIKKAAESDIPVVAVLPALPEPKPEPSQYGLFDYVTPSHADEGTTLGHWIVQDSPDGASVIRLTSPEFPDLQREGDSLAAVLSAAGPEFEIADEVQSPVTDILGGPQGVQRLVGAMRNNPEAKYMFTLSESWAQIFLQASKLANRDDVTALGSDGDFSVPLVQKGTKIVMVGPDTETYGYYAVDGLIRAFNGEEAIGGYFPEFQLVDATNADQVKGPGITAAYDYRSEWKKLWGAS